MITQGPPEGYPSMEPARPHGRVWRAVLFLGGGVAAVVAGIALSAAFAGTAAAAPLPAPIPVTAPTLGTAAAAGQAITTPAGGALRAVPGVVSARRAPRHR